MSLNKPDYLEDFIQSSPTTFVKTVPCKVTCDKTGVTYVTVEIEDDSYTASIAVEQGGLSWKVECGPFSEEQLFNLDNIIDLLIEQIDVLLIAI